MKLLIFGEFCILLEYDEDYSYWAVRKVFRHFPDRYETETSSINAVPWHVREAVADICGNPMP